MKIFSLVAAVAAISVPAFAQSHRFDPGGKVVDARAAMRCGVPPDFGEELHGSFFSCGGRLIFVRNAYLLGIIKADDIFLCEVGINAAGGEVAENCRRERTVATKK